MQARLIDACIKVIAAAQRPGDVCVRSIASAAETSPSTLYTYYASLDELVAAAAKRLYLCLNQERLQALQQGVSASSPATPPVRLILAAMVGPPVRWSLDPAKPYAVFTYLNALRSPQGPSDALKVLIDHVDQFTPFIRYLQQAAPWFDRVEIGWRVSATLGVRSQVLRDARRTRLLTNNQLDLDDPDTVIEMILDAAEPMFTHNPLNSGAGARARAKVRRHLSCPSSNDMEQVA
jgi:AcrR family transcriptional regulator